MAHFDGGVGLDEIHVRAKEEKFCTLTVPIYM